MPSKVVFITGASSGIGRALALEYAHRGARVAVAARREAELVLLRSEIERAKTRAMIFPLDVRDAHATKEALAKADRDLGPLSVVVANAGVSAAGLPGTIEWADVERVLDINVKGAICTLVHALPILMMHGRGHLVGISSLAGRAGLPQSAVYSASKAALTTYLQSIRVDLRPVGIAVSDVQAGFVRTPMTEGSSFPRPFEWEVDRAARYIVGKLDKRPAIVDFQFPLTAVTNLVRVMPRGLYDRLAPLVIRR